MARARGSLRPEAASGAGGTQPDVGGQPEATGRSEVAGCYHQVFEASHLPMYVCGTDGEILEVNPALCRLLGYPADQLVGRALGSLSADPPLAASELDGFLEGKASEHSCTRRYRRADGRVVAVRVTLGAVRDARGRARTIFGQLEDLTSDERAGQQAERERGRQPMATGARSARLPAERALSRALEASMDAVIGVDQAGLVTDWNPAAEAMFGWFRDEVAGRELVPRICSPQATGALQRLFSDLEAAGGSGAEVPGARAQLEAVSRDGRHFPVEASLARVDDDGVALYRLFLRDLSERKAYEGQLVRNALFDPLTGLPNRALLLDRLAGAIGRLSRVEGLVAVLFVDLDRFKILNESLGPRAGDELLVQLGHRLRSVLRPADTVARLRGDEFVVLCEALGNEREVMALADRAQGVLAKPFVLASQRGQEVYASASVGISLARAATADPESLVGEAEIAMRRAKEHGGGQAEVFDAEAQRRSMAHLETETQLRRALERSELCVYYQPLVDLTGQLQEVEALVRWAHPSGRVALPAEFVPLAEQTGLIVALGEAVLQMACEQAARWRSAYPRLANLGLAVNVSGAQLRRADAVERLLSIVGQSGLPPSALTLEITESVLMDESTGVGRKLASLRSVGARLAIDDFGTGYSSLLFLRRYPLDVLKIDRSFVAGLVDNPEDAAIVEAVVRLGHSFGLKTVAEGVETAQQLELLHRLDCDMGQGYLWGRPLPPDSLISYVLPS